jgi:hypothetical protein
MRRVHVFGSTIGVLVLAAACATTPANVGESRYSTTPSPQPVRNQSSAAMLDSIRAQAIADREGPGASIRAEIETVNGSRRARALFHLDDDAYVMIGHIDPEGIVRIVFPSDPVDDGFVKGQRSYQTGQFFAGFNAQFRNRYSTTGMFRTSSAAQDSYDGGVGYVFMIASWRPMRFDAFRDGARWDTYELASDDYIRDPRPAIQELASLLVADVREAYTLKFARYFDTQSLYAGGFGGGGYDALGLEYCAGYEPAGFASPFFFSGFNPFGSIYSYGSSFTRRGTSYYYDAGSDCYRTSNPYGGYGYGFGGYQIAQNVPAPSRPRTFDIEKLGPHIPKVTVGHTFPVPGEVKPSVPEQGPHTSPTYRQRGLITPEEPATGPARRGPQIQAATPPNERSRPTLEQMTERRAQQGNEQSNIGRTRAIAGDGRTYEPSGSSPVTRGRVQAGNDGTSPEVQRAYPRPETSNPRTEPVRSEPTPRMQAPERSAPPPRSEPPAARFEPPAARSAPPSSPPPSAPPPSSPPASSSSGTPVKPPTA